MLIFGLYSCNSALGGTKANPYVDGCDLCARIGFKKIPSATMFTSEIDAKKMSMINDDGIWIDLRMYRGDKAESRGSRLNMNYPYKLHSWRVTAMTVVAQRHTTQDIHGDHLAAKQIKHQWLFLSVFCTKSVAYKIRLLLLFPPRIKKKKTSTSSIESTSAFGAVYKKKIGNQRWRTKMVFTEG